MSWVNSCISLSLLQLVLQVLAQWAPTPLGTWAMLQVTVESSSVRPSVLLCQMTVCFLGALSLTSQILHMGSVTQLPDTLRVFSDMARHRTGK